MFVVDVIQRAVKGDLRFEFIDSSITVSRGNFMSSAKGSGYSTAANGAFGYHFTPRTPLPPEWAGPDGFLDPARTHGMTFQVAGTERNSASWHGEVENLRLTRTLDGVAVHGLVREWTRVDEKAVNTAFVRIIVPGRRMYPALLRHAPGKTDRSASVTVNGFQIDFRDYGAYSEISTLDNRNMPADFADKVVHALGSMLNTAVSWVYRERHEDRCRMISVRALPDAPAGSAEISGQETLPAYADFWEGYAKALGTLLQAR